jgi:UDP-N-acetylglucosamine/UDP-N-acetylgalactosamine diphosphorylase
LVVHEAQHELTIEDLRACFARQGQDHVFADWEQLDDARRAALCHQASRLAPQLSSLLSARRAALSGHGASSASGSGSVRIEPPSVIELPERGGDPALRSEARSVGERILSQGRLAVFVVAGGQGTRLGFPHPKGCFAIGPVGDRSLFEVQAQKIRGLARRCGCPVPWYVMTSAATDAETREAFDRERYFGLDPADVAIFQQDMVPAFDFEGRLLLEAPDRIFESPDGHGGSLTALASSGMLDDMARRGIDTIFFYQVDNPLVRIGDPVYLGLHDQARAEMSCKVVRKVDPLEKVGVFAEIDGRLSVVEYTEFDPRQRDARDSKGRLRFWAGNAAIHLLNVEFVRRVAAEPFELLPFHLSAKKIPTIDILGRSVTPDEPNGHKLERFVFDALGAAERTCVVEASAAEEFSPIKNASGKNSPETSRQALVAQYRRWLQAAGLELPDENERIEIDHSVIDGPEDAAAAGFASLEDAGDVIRTTRGRDS